MTLARRTVLAAGLASLALPAQARWPRRQTGYVGCYTTGQGPPDLGVHLKAEGIYAFDLVAVTGQLENFRLAAATPSPTNSTPYRCSME